MKESRAKFDRKCARTRGATSVFLSQVALTYGSETKLKQFNRGTMNTILLGLEAIASLLLGLFFLGEGITLVKLSGVLLVGIGVLVLRA